MTITIMKTVFKKKKPKIIQYRDYKKFSNAVFRSELIELLYIHDVNNIHYNDFDNLVMGLLNIYAPIKYKYIRANEAPFMNKEFKNAIMVRSKLKNIYNREKSVPAHTAYKKQRNLCSNLLNKIKISLYSNLNPSRISDNKTFWSTMKPIFSDKKSYNININLIENNKIVTEDNKLAKCFKYYFENSVKELNIDMDPVILSTSDNIDNVMNYIDKFKIHPSILKIKDVVNIDKTFNFDFIDITNMTKIMYSLDTTKSNPINSISAKIILSNSDKFIPILHNNFNNNIINRIFPLNLKLSDITPTHKKNDRLLKENYRPISVLPAISKIYEKLMAEQLNK